MERIINVWFLPSENTWRDLNIMAMKDRGTLSFREKELIFQGKEYEVKIKDIKSISYGKQGRDFVNNWVKIEYRTDDGEIKTAFFADGGMMGWSGIFGGTKKILNKITERYT